MGTGNPRLKAVGELRSTTWTNRCLTSRLESSSQIPNEQADVCLELRWATQNQSDRGGGWWR